MEDHEFGMELAYDNCSQVVNACTPKASPGINAFCGIWVSDSHGNNGSWLEGPYDYPANSSYRKRSYSNIGKRSDWVEDFDTESDQISFSLIDATFSVSICTGCVH